MARQKKPRDRKEATFLEHLEELRQRLIRCFIYVTVAAIVTFAVRHQLMELAQYPIYRAGELAGIGNIEFKEFRPAGALVLSFHIAFVAGIILASPLWLLEAWMFIEPALEDHERKWVVPLLPFAVFLFISGVGFCYWMCPRAFAILLKFQRDLGVAPEFILRDYLTFFLRLLLIFGVMFELPLVIMFLSAVGIVKSEYLAKHWRIAVVVIAVACAVVTPTPDAVTLLFLAGPMVGLYLLSIVLARFVEKGRERAGVGRDTGPVPAVEAESATDPAPDPYAGYASEEGAEGRAAEEATGEGASVTELVETPPQGAEEDKTSDSRPYSDD